MVVSVAGEENRGMSSVIFSSFFQERDKDGGKVEKAALAALLEEAEAPAWATFTAFQFSWSG